MSEKTRDILLFGTIVVGICLTLFGSLDNDPTRNDKDGQTAEVVALLNGEPVSKARFRSAQFREGSDIPDRRKLDQFLAEQIILNKAISSGILERDQRLRAAILEAMREFTVSADPVAEPSEATLLAHYEATKAEYAPPSRYQVRYRALDDNEVPENVFDGVATARFLPAGILRRSIGREAASALSEMTIGEQRVFDRGGENLVVVLDDVRAGSIPEFEVIKLRVLEDWYRIEEDRRYAAYLQRLIEETDIQYLDGEQD
jgi:hypothetical protein